MLPVLEQDVAVLEHAVAVLEQAEAVSLCPAIPPSLLQSITFIFDGNTICLCSSLFYYYSHI